MNYYLGIDVGATKTAALICDESGKMLGTGMGGPGNHQSVEYEGMTIALLEALQGALSQAKISPAAIAGAGFGIAGFDWHSEEPLMRAVINKTGIQAPMKLVNDVVLGLLAGTSEGWGVAVVSGTGCNCRGWDREHKREGRVTGYGDLMGEGTGATELIIHAMRKISHVWTRRIPHSALADAFMHEVGATDLEDLIHGYTSNYYDIGPEFAPLVFRVAEQGDPVARELISDAGKELGEMANAVIRQLDFQSIEFEVALIGSMFKNGDRLISPMRETVHALAPHAKLIPVEVKPVVGAVLLGMEAAGLVLTHEQRKQIKESLSE